MTAKVIARRRPVVLSVPSPNANYLLSFVLSAPSFNVLEPLSVLLGVHSLKIEDVLSFGLSTTNIDVLIYSRILRG